MALKNIFLEIALKDLQSAYLLYENKMYSQSFFLFQQASEKANKALGLSIEGLSENKVLGIQHNQIKIHSITASSQLSQIESTIKKLANHPEITNHELFNKIDFNSYIQILKNSVSHLNSIKKDDIINLSKYDLVRFIDILEELYNARIILNKKSKEEFLSNLNIYIDFIKTFGSANAQNDLLQANTDEQKKELISIVKIAARHQFKMLFIYYSLFLCALITSQHYNLSRYPDETHNPLYFYKKSNPIIKYQLIFMNYLKKAIIMLQKYESIEIKN